MCWKIDALNWRTWPKNGYVYADIPGLARISKTGLTYSLRRFDHGDEPHLPKGARFNDINLGRLHEVLDMIATEIGFDATSYKETTLP